MNEANEGSRCRKDGGRNGRKAHVKGRKLRKE